MDFDFTPEQEMLRREIRDFMEKESPREYVRECDEKEEFPHELWGKLAEAGWIGLAIPEAYGGSGGSIMDLALVIEEIGRVNAGMARAFWTSTCFGANSVGVFGTDEQKDEFLPRLARGEIKFCFGVTEPDTGMDTLALKTLAVPDGDYYVINGQKTFITLAHMADYMLLMTRTTWGAPKKSFGITMFLVDAKAAGITTAPIKKLGGKALGINQVFLTDVRVPKACILGEVDHGWYHVLHTMNNERISVAAMALGVARAAFEDALEYAKQRVVFGKPIGQFQAIQHYLAEMFTEIETARWMVYRAAWLQSLGRPCGVEASMAKMVAGGAAFNVANKGMQILAGYSYSMEFDMQRYWRDARLWSMVPATDEMVKNFIGQSLGLPKSY